MTNSKTRIFFLLGLPGKVLPGFNRILLITLSLVCMLPSSGLARGVHALFDLEIPAGGPFPGDQFTVVDPSQNTGLRVSLPKPNCLERVSDCEDIDVINTLDGFNLQPRLSIPFDGPIDVATVTSRTIFLVRLGSTLPGGDRGGRVIGINQVVWDPATFVLHVESDELLEQHTRYGLIVTRGVNDISGDPVEATADFRFLLAVSIWGRWWRGSDYGTALLDALEAARQAGVAGYEVVSASVFTTQSVTAILEKIRDQIKAQTPQPADFNIGPGGTRAVFDLDDVAGLAWHRQIRVNPPAFSDEPPNPFFAAQVNPQSLRVIPGAVSQIAWGKFVSPDYMIHPGEYIPPVGTRTGMPAIQGVNEIYFYLTLPSGPKPEGGWPVAIRGHGGGSAKQEINNTAAPLAELGIASIAIDYAGSGFGPLSTMTVRRTGGEPATFPVGGRGRDQNNDNVIGMAEGVSATRPRNILSFADGMRQTVADWMQLVRVIQVGIDVDGDGTRDLNPGQISYYGYSGGGIFGPAFVAVEPDVRSGFFGAGGGGGTSSTNALAVLNRPGTGNALNARVPSLLNPGPFRINEMEGVPVGTSRFHENFPLRDGLPMRVRLNDGTAHTIQSPVANTVDGAIAIQQYLENQQWASLTGDPLGYVRHLRKDPLPGVPAKSVLFLIAKGDQQVPNPATTALIRAGDLADRTTLYRHDVAYAEHPTLPKNPHPFFPGSVVFGRDWDAIGLEPQRQVAIFLASDGQTIVHPEPKHYYEVPVTALPEDLGVIP